MKKSILMFFAIGLAVSSSSWSADPSLLPVVRPPEKRASLLKSLKSCLGSDCAAKTAVVVAVGLNVGAACYLLKAASDELKDYIYSLQVLL